MDIEQIISQAKRISTKAQNSRSREIVGYLTEASELIRTFAGERSIFYKNISKVDQNKFPII